MLPSFEVFGRTVGTYFIFVFLGLLACGFVAIQLGKRFQTTIEDMILQMLVVSTGALIGGYLLYGVTNSGKIRMLLQNASQYEMLDLLRSIVACFSGMVFYGGLIGAAIALLLYSHFSKAIKVKEAFDLFAVAVPLFHVFGRIGCFFAGCCYGIESNWGMVVHGNSYYPEVNDITRVPVQLIEAGVNLCIFLLLLTFFRKCYFQEKLFFLYLLVYPTARFGLEFLRGDSIRGFLFGLSTSQVISVLLFAFSCMLLVLLQMRKRST